MAYRASTYRPGTEDEPNGPPSRSIRERSPRRNERLSPGREASAGQGSRRLERSENRSRSPDRSSPKLGSSRRKSELEKRREYENIEREQRAKEAFEYKKEISENSSDRRQPNFQPKEFNDREWGKLHAAIYARVGLYADEIIRGGWQGGAKVTKENSPRFAAEVLLYVRNKFYTEIAKVEAEFRAAGYEPKRDPPSGPSTHKLVLEDMKWVCDTKIKPVTDQYSNELFLCNGCEHKNRLYTLESVLQHYASKHTNTLSKGTVVVHWRAEWPENPPFNPEPDVVMNTFHFVGPSSTISANGPLTSPRVLRGNSEIRELEKKKCEQEIREREIQIKEAKEKIERKEREKAEKEYESKERQTRAAEAAERKKRELADQTAASKKPLSDSQRGAGGASSVQRNGPSTSQADNHNTPQTGRDVTTDFSEGSPLAQLQNSDPKSKSRSPSTRSVEMSNMDSTDSDLRNNQRLHLAALFTRFMSEVSQQTALQLRRDSAKKILEQKTAAYEKAHIMHKEFPSAEESTKASKERAQKEFEKVENELIRKREASVKLSEEISEIVYPEEEPSDSDRNVAAKIKHLEDKLAQYEADSEFVKDKQQQLDSLYSTLMTQNDKQIILDVVGDGFRSFRQEVSDVVAKTSSLKAEMTEIKHSEAPTDLRNSFDGLILRINNLEQQTPSEGTEGLKSIIDHLASRVDEFHQARKSEAGLRAPTLDVDITNLRSIMDKLSSRMDSLEVIKSEMSKAVETINSTLALQSAAINDRSEMQSVHSSIKAFSRSEGEIRTGFAKLQSQMQALGKDLRAIKMVERGPRSSDATALDSNGLSNDMRIAIHDEIRAQQEAVDIVLDEKLGNLEGELGGLKGQFKPLEIQLAELDGSLKSFQNQYAAQIDPIAIDLGGVRGDVNSTREEINALKQNEIHTLQNDIHSLQLAYNSLDFRMNNLSTEHLARQILGQLDAHIRGSENNIVTLELRLQQLERRAANGEVSTISKRDVEEILRKLRKELTDEVDERLEKFNTVVLETNNDLVKEQMQLRNEVDTKHSKWQNVKADVEASKTNIAEAMGLLRTEVDTLISKTQTLKADLSASKIDFTETTKSLRAEVDSIGPTLQTVQDDLGATKNSCKEAAASLKVEIAKATKTIPPEKRKIESPAQSKTNGHKKRRVRRSISDSDDDA